MKNYLDALKYCYANGDFVKSRAGNVKKAFGYQMRFNLEDAFQQLRPKNLLGKQQFQNYYGFQKAQTMREDQLKFFMIIKEKI